MKYPKRQMQERVPAPALFCALFVVERGDARQLQSFQELQRSAAAGGDVGHLVGKAELGDSSHAVAAADDRDGARSGNRFGDLQGALGKGQ